MKNNKEKLQNLLKSNLKNEIIKLLENDKQSFLYILDNKKDIIINTIKVTYEKVGIKDNLIDDDIILNDDYNYLDDAFFSVYSVIESEEKRKQELKAEERQEKLIKYLEYLFNASIAGVKKEGFSEAQAISSFKKKEARDIIFNSIDKDLKDDCYTIEEKIDAYNKVMVRFLEEYNLTNLDTSVQEQDVEDDEVKLHWIWKANIVVDAIREFIEHF